MRRILLSVMVVVAVVATAPGVAAGKRQKPHCAIPYGWLMAAQSAQIVAIHKDLPAPFGPAPTFEYCARPATHAPGAGRFRLLVKTTGCCPEGGGAAVGSPTSVDHLTLSGGFIAYVAYWGSRGYGGEASRVRIVNTHDATIVEAQPPTGFAPLHTLLLSSTGVAVWLESVLSYQPPSGDEIQSLVSQTGQSSTLDTAAPGELTDIQLYQCVAGTGCPDNAPVVVRWLNAGQQREAVIG